MELSRLIFAGMMLGQLVHTRGEVEKTDFMLTLYVHHPLSALWSLFLRATVGSSPAFTQNSVALILFG